MINIQQIKKIENAKKQIKKEIYIKLFEQFSRKISNAVNMNQIQVFLQVPAFLIGYPVFNLEHATNYLKRQLELSGFTVVKISYRDLYVSWCKKKGKKKKREKVTPAAEDNDDDANLPSLVNLKKIANKYRNA